MPMPNTSKLLAFSIASLATLAAALVVGQGALVRKKNNIPTELMVKPPEKGPMLAEALLKVDPNVIISRKAAFKPLEGKLTVTPLNPMGANGAIFAQYIYGLNIVEGKMMFKDKYGGAGVYFRPTKVGAEYLAEFTIEVHKDNVGPLAMYASGSDVKPVEKKTYSLYDLKPGIHKLTTTVTADGRDFVMAYLLATEGGWWSLHSATIRKAD